MSLRLGFLGIGILLVLVGKLSGFFKDVFLTYFHGISLVTDAYFIAMSVSSAMYMAIYLSIPIVVVPACARINSSVEQHEAGAHLGAMLWFYILISALCSVAAYCMSGFLIGMLSQSPSAEVARNAELYLSVMGLGFVLSTVLAFINCMKTVDGKVMSSYVVPLVNNSFFCISLILFHGSEQFSYVLWAGVIAWLVLLAFGGRGLPSLLASGLKGVFAGRLDRRFLSVFVSAVSAFYIEQAITVVPIYFSSSLGEGMASAIGYAAKLNLLFLSIFSIFLTTSIFPMMARLESVRKIGTISTLSVSTIRVFLIFFTPIFLYCSVFSDEIVSLVFQRGGFLESDTFIVSSVFSILVFSIPFVALKDVLYRVYFSSGKTFLPLICSSVALLSAVVLAQGLSSSYGLVGVAAAVLISSVINVLLALWTLWVFEGLNYTGVVLRAIYLPALISCFCIFIAFPFSGLHHYSWVVGGVTYVVFYLCVAKLLRIEEVGAIFGMAKKFLK
ncbi:MAG: hypothetical protein KBT87_05595 [Gammaproteobacteria bacterium]|jgi:putative peptidoglycan lipid II flippase|nr:hypothetical protein [Gammaproteobacteria bacterium]MBQ0774129.1 hypothetical protein [Gammaproteobacteria bacterium]